MKRRSFVKTAATALGLFAMPAVGASMAPPPTRKSNKVWATEKPECDLEKFERTLRTLRMKSEDIAASYLMALGDGKTVAAHVPVTVVERDATTVRLGGKLEWVGGLESVAISQVQIVDDEGYGFPPVLFHSSRFLSLGDTYNVKVTIKVD